ncbi:MAG: NAD(P)/FAD-dependent oxidoreductase [Actinomycetota bacterium]|nr:NAD(P)/FAD-dependent oxidoreductase [Actinomycetota bacterium]
MHSPTTPTPAVTTTDLLVVGAGPTGLFTATYAGFRGLSVALVDSLAEAGGQVAAMYPEKQILDVAGFPAVKGRELVDGLVRQAARANPTYLLQQQVSTLTYDDGGLPVVTTSTGATVRCKALVLTAGIGSFAPRPLPAAASYEDRGLAYFVPRLEDYRDRDVLIVGGGDSAVDWALNLEPIARSVTLVHRRKRFRAHAGSVDQLLASGVEVVTDAEVTAVRGESCVEAVDITVKGEPAPRTLKCQRIVAALGFTANLGPLLSWGLDVRGRQILVDTRMATNLPRVYAAGDVTEYPGKVRLIAVGFGEAATAVNNAAVEIDPSAAVFPGHSTDLDA